MKTFVYNNYALNAISDDIFTEKNFFNVVIKGVKTVPQNEILKIRNNSDKRFKLQHFIDFNLEYKRTQEIVELLHRN